MGNLTISKRSHHGSKPSMVAPNSPDHTADLSQLFIGSKLACGANSKLYHGTYKDEPVAVKFLDQPESIPICSYCEDNQKSCQLLEKQFNREVSLLSRLHHPNVIKLVASWSQPSSVHCIVTEFLSEGSLRAYLNKLEERGSRISMQKLVSVSLEIARGMEYIHSQGIVHRDLKPENVLIDRDFHMKIADFGVSCLEGEPSGSQDEPGTYRWMAPEVIKRKSHNRKVDVYSFGLMLSEMVSGNIPFKGMSPVQAAYAVANKNLRPVLPEDCPALVRNLIERCWSSEPKKRPEFLQIIKVLEEFESSLAADVTAKLVKESFRQNQKKGGFLCRIRNKHNFCHTVLKFHPIIS